jgi:hypothetical protein
MPLRTFAAVIGLMAMTLIWMPRAALAQPAPVSRPAELRIGTCASPGDLVMALANLVTALGDPQGQTGATPVEQSGTVVPYTVPDLLATNHVVTVLKSAEEREVIVACGEVGGTLNPDGTLAIGMSGMNGSGLSGITYFTPNPGFDNTLITILLVPAGSVTTENSAIDPAR